MAGGVLYGLLLAAGKGARFRAAGGANKLLSPCYRDQFDSPAVVLAAATTLLQAVDRLVVVIPENSSELVACLGAVRATIIPIQSEGIGDSIAQAVALCPQPSGFLIALADMPYVQPDTLQQVAAALNRNSLVVPTWQGRRGHPRAIGSRFAGQLLQLSGDRGAQALFSLPQVVEVAVDDPGILHDIDLPEHLLT